MENGGVRSSMGRSLHQYNQEAEKMIKITISELWKQIRHSQQPRECGWREAAEAQERSVCINPHSAALPHAACRKVACVPTAAGSYKEWGVEEGPCPPKMCGCAFCPVWQTRSACFGPLRLQGFPWWHLSQDLRHLHLHLYTHTHRSRQLRKSSGHRLAAWIREKKTRATTYNKE